MPSTVLSQAGAFNPGSDLWILPDLGKSRWTDQIDWYLNFQICNATRHSSKPLPPFLTSILQDTGLETINFQQPMPSALMISSQELLPNKWTVILPWQDDVAQWASRAYEIWQNLKMPTLRIFLPPGQNAGAFEAARRADSFFQDFTIVLD
jgi:hypothetical protein